MIAMLASGYTGMLERKPSDHILRSLYIETFTEDFLVS